MLSVQGNRRRDRALCPLALALEPSQTVAEAPAAAAAANRSGFPAGRAGWSKGVERKGEEPGRLAGGACSLPEPRQPRRSLLCSLCPSLRLGRALRRDPRPTPGAPLLLGPRARRGEATLSEGAVPSGWGFGGRLLLSLAGGLAGKEGESGDTHLPRRARIAHSQLRAPAEARPGRVWPRGSGPGTCQLSAILPAPPPARRPSRPWSALLSLRPGIATTSR